MNKKLFNILISCFFLIFLGCNSGIDKEKLAGSFRSEGPVDFGLLNSFIPDTGALGFAKNNTKLKCKFNKDGTVEFGQAGLFGSITNAFTKSAGYNLKMKLDGNTIIREDRLNKGRYIDYMEIVEYDDDYQNITLKNLNLGEKYKLVRVN